MVESSRCDVLHYLQESPGSDADMSGEETTDERATLLDAEGGTSSLQSMRFTKRKLYPDFKCERGTEVNLQFRYFRIPREQHFYR